MHVQFPHSLKHETTVQDGFLHCAMTGLLKARQRCMSRYKMSMHPRTEPRVPNHPMGNVQHVHQVLACVQQPMVVLSCTDSAPRHRCAVTEVQAAKSLVRQALPWTMSVPMMYRRVAGVNAHATTKRGEDHNIRGNLQLHRSQRCQAVVAQESE